jgi:hypothetical protein
MSIRRTQSAGRKVCIVVAKVGAGQAGGARNIDQLVQGHVNALQSFL